MNRLNYNHKTLVDDLMLSMVWAFVVSAPLLAGTACCCPNA